MDDDCDDDDPCPDCGGSYCSCDEEPRSDHERGACWGPGCCEECDTPPDWWVREYRAVKPQRGSRSAHRRLSRTRTIQAERRRTAAHRRPCDACSRSPNDGGCASDCDSIPF